MPDPIGIGNHRLRLDQKFLRARQTASQLIHGLEDFIPRACMHEARHYLEEQLLKSNLALIQVDPRWDAYTDAQLTVVMLNTHPYVIANPELKTEIGPTREQSGWPKDFQPR